jgi:hypothetical protein
MERFAGLEIDIDFPLSDIVIELRYTDQLLSSFEIVEQRIQTGDDFVYS